MNCSHAFLVTLLTTYCLTSINNGAAAAAPLAGNLREYTKQKLSLSPGIEPSTTRYEPFQIEQRLARPQLLQQQRRPTMASSRQQANLQERQQAQLQTQQTHLQRQLQQDHQQPYRQQEQLQPQLHQQQLKQQLPPSPDSSPLPPLEVFEAIKNRRLWQDWFLNDDANRAYASAIKDQVLDDGSVINGLVTRSHSHDEKGNYDSGQLLSEANAVSGGHRDPSSDVYRAGSSQKRQNLAFSKVVEGGPDEDFFFKSVSKAEETDRSLSKQLERKKKNKTALLDGYRKKSSQTKLTTTLTTHKKKTSSEVQSHRKNDSGPVFELGKNNEALIASGNARINKDGSMSTSAKGAFGASETLFLPPPPPPSRAEPVAQPAQKSVPRRFPRRIYV